MRVSVVSMSGLELAAVDADLQWTKDHVLEVVPEQAIRARTRVLCGTVELHGNLKIADVCSACNISTGNSYIDSGSDSNSRSSAKRARHGIELTLLSECYMVATASSEGTVKLWSVGDSNRCFRTLEDCDVVICIDFSPCNENVVTVSQNGSVKQWSVASGESCELDRPWPLPCKTVSAKYSPCGKKVLMLSETDQVFQYLAPTDLARGGGLFLLGGQTAEVAYVAAYSPCGTEIWTISSHDGTASKWSSSTGSLLCKVNVHDEDHLRGSGALIPGVFSCDGKRIFSLFRFALSSGPSIAKVSESLLLKVQFILSLLLHFI